MMTVIWQHKMTDLRTYISDRSSAAALQTATGEAILALAGAAARIATVIREPDASADFAAARGSANADGDIQKALDVICDEIVAAALSAAGVATYLSEEREDPVPMNDDGLVIVACDPLDGSSNIDTNLSIGTIFSLLPAAAGPLQPGRNQLASGFFVYGPQTTLLLTMGQGVHAFQMDSSGVFHLLDWAVSIPAQTSEFAINAANSRFWHAPAAAYVADCVAGADGPRGRDFNMRWLGSLVADSWRIFRRGGVFLYPGDRRTGYSEGRLRLVYEAAPVAFLVEQAGGSATNGAGAVMDIIPGHLHQRVPFLFGSCTEIDEIVRHHSSSEPPIRRE
jgi:fructose-1,6-bisphosphatase I